MAVLLLADVNDGTLATDSVAKTIAAVKGLGEVHLLVPGPAAAAAEAAKLDGVAKVLHAADAAYDHGLAESIAALMVSLAGGYEHICGAATAFCKNVMPRVAALLDVMVMSDVTAVVDAGTFERPIYAGNAIQTVKSGDAKKVFTVRTANFTAVGVQHLGDAGDGGCGLRGAGRVVAGDEHVNVTTTLHCRGDGVEGRTLQGAVIVFGNNENAHVRSPSLRA